MFRCPGATTTTRNPVRSNTPKTDATSVSDTLRRAADMPHLSHRVAHVVFLAAVRADTVCITRGDLLYPDVHRNPPATSAIRLGLSKGVAKPSCLIGEYTSAWSGEVRLLTTPNHRAVDRQCLCAAEVVVQPLTCASCLRSSTAITRCLGTRSCSRRLSRPVVLPSSRMAGTRTWVSRSRAGTGLKPLTPCPVTWTSQ